MSTTEVVVQDDGEYLMDIFIDHNPQRFTKVIDSLRDREVPTEFDSSREREQLMKDLKTFGPFNNLIKQEEKTLYSSDISLEDQILSESDEQQLKIETKQDIIVELAHSSNQHHPAGGLGKQPSPDRGTRGILLILVYPPVPPALSQGRLVTGTNSRTHELVVLLHLCLLFAPQVFLARCQ